MSRRPLTTLAALAEAGMLANAEAPGLQAVAARYAIGLTPAVAALIDRTDPADPIALQYLPQVAELVTTAEERADPIGDHAHSPLKGLVHRYPDRVLLKAVHVCPVYCRFCFRREMVGPSGDGTLSADELDAALAYVAAHSEIWEVILTGGDPLMLSPRRLRAIAEGLRAAPHARILRLHSRVPVTDPARISNEWLDALAAAGKTVYLAIHVNHPRELGAPMRHAINRLADAGIALLSQTVLLKGVNDRIDVLASLMRDLVELRVRPYYLHHPDLAPGTSHFRVSLEEGRALAAALRGHVSGLAQPTYVLDIPGGYGKAAVAAETAVSLGDGRWQLTDYRGQKHVYPPENI